MHNRARALCAVSVIFAVFFLVAGTALAAQDQKDQKKDKKVDKAQQAEMAALVKVVDDVVAGQPAPTDIPMAWQVNFLKAREQKTFVPFTLQVDRDKAPNPSVAVYLRVVNRNQAAATPAAQPADAKKDEKKAKNGRPEYAFEDIYFTELKGDPGQPYRLTRAFAVPGGDYDVYIVVRERSQAKPDKNAPAPKTGLFKQQLSVPNFWTDELMTSSIILASKAEQLTAPPTEAEMATNPYTFGTTKITPSFDDKFAKKDELSIIFLIYNTALDTKPDAAGKPINKPDVSVEYNFYQKTGGAEKFFNKTNPQNFNATTLPPQFDVNAGHQLVGGLSVPLTSFPEGEYRLEIKVTDKVAGKTKVENANFTVAGS